MESTKTLIKTDRNGTRYYDVTDVCPRCGGRGDYIRHYNYGVCFLCGGSGVKHYTVKEYTPEHEAKLEAQRVKRAEKRAEAWAQRNAKREASEAARRAEEAAHKAVSQYVGEVGTRVKVAVKVEHIASYEVPAFNGFGTTTKTVYVFSDAAGNKLVWHTTSRLKAVVDGQCVPVETGAEVTIAGTVKRHGEYKGEKQTELQRVKAA